MSLRTTTQAIAFPRAFSLAGVEAKQPAGVYPVETDEELIEGLSFPAYRRVCMRIRLSESAAQPGIVETVVVNPAEIEAILADK